MSLVENLQIRAASTLYDASTGTGGLSGSGKAFGSGTVTITENTDTAFIRTPGLTKNIKVVVDSTAGNTNGFLDIAINQSWQDIHQWGFWAYISDTAHMGGAGTTDGVVSTIATESALTNRYDHYLLSTTGFGVSPGAYANGWNFANFTKPNFSASSGSPNYNAAQLKHRVRMQSQAGNIVTFYFESILYDYFNKPVVIVSFDDNYPSVYSEWTNYLSDRDVRCTLAWNGEKHGVDGWMTPDQANELYEAGWSIVTHGWTHEAYAGQSVSYIEDQYSQGLELLRANGWTRDITAAIFPEGSYDANVNTALRNLGVVEGFGTYTRVMPQVYGLENAMHLPRTNMDETNGLSAATIKQYIDRAKQTGGLMHIYSHDIQVGASGLQTEQSKFRSVIDHLVQLRDSNQILLLTTYEYRLLRNGGRLPRWA